MKKIIISLAAILIVVVVKAQNENQCISGNCNNGIGKYSYSHGKTYEGKFKKGKPNGEGVLTESNVDSTIWLINSKEQKQATTTILQKGIWKDGELNGQGYMLIKSQKFEESKEAFPDSSNGKKYVYNSYSIENYIEITGNFVNGILNGYGVTESYITKKNDPNSKIGIKKYEGNFKNNERNGKGKLYKWVNGSYQLTNEGEFLNGKFIEPLK